MSANRADLDHFYSLLERLRKLPHQGRSLGEYTGRVPWPIRGVYFFLEPGEYRTQNSDAPRVVRVGTHAVSVGSKSTLWGRLRAHCGSQSGTGNHRGSIFRLHVGAAMCRWRWKATLDLGRRLFRSGNHKNGRSRT